MKRMKIFLQVAILLLLALNMGCSKNEETLPEDAETEETAPKDEETEEVTPKLVISATDYRIGKDAGSQTIVSFTINVDFDTAISYKTPGEKWLSMTYSKNEANDSVRLVLTATKNRSVEEERVAYVDISYAEQSKRLTITQEKNELKLVISATDYRIGKEAESQTIVSFTINVDFDTAISYKTPGEKWLSMTYSKNEANDSVRLVLTATENRSAEEERVAYVDISYADQSKRLTVTQEKNEKYGNLADYFDPKFADVLQKQRYIKDRTDIKIEQIKNIKELKLYDENLTSLRGIEYFESLEGLYCLRNQLTSLDVSKNTKLKYLHCYSNQLTSLDVSGCTALTELECGSNQLTSLDVSKNTALTKLWCYSNQLSSLDVSECIALADLNCSKNQLTSLDVSKNTALWSLNCTNNQLTSLDVSGCTKLGELKCWDNKLTSLDVSKNTALWSLYCRDNQLTSLDVSQNTALRNLSCYNNPGQNQYFTITIGNIKPTISKEGWMLDGLWIYTRFTKVE